MPEINDQSPERPSAKNYPEIFREMIPDFLREQEEVLSESERAQAALQENIKFGEKEGQILQDEIIKNSKEFMLKILHWPQGFSEINRVYPFLFDISIIPRSDGLGSLNYEFISFEDGIKMMINKSGEIIEASVLQNREEVGWEPLIIHDYEIYSGKDPANLDPVQHLLRKLMKWNNSIRLEPKNEETSQEF